MTTLEPSPELAPSETRVQEPTFARMLGAIGLCMLLLGTIAIIANQYGPRFVGTSGGYFFAAIGAALLLFHAHTDGDYEFRRAYTALGYLVIFAFLLTGTLTLMGRDSFAGSGALIPPLLAIFGLALTNATARHETDANFKNTTLLVWLAIGAFGCVGAVVAGMAEPAFLVGPGIVLALISLAYLCAFLTGADSSHGIGYAIAVGLGVLGGVAVFYALAKAIWPTVLHDGPGAIRNAFQTTDYWKLTARVICILAFLGIAAWGWRRRGVLARWGLIAFGLSFAGVLLYGTLATSELPAPKPYFVPSGLLLSLIGVIYLAASLACVSDSVYIALTRREIAAIFYSPIAYILLGGAAIMAAAGYAYFLSDLVRMMQSSGGVAEPILQNNQSLEFLAAISTLFIVPAITMRAFSEEKRNATLEVLLTAPVNEFSIVMSKFTACWLMYMLTFAPAGLYLIGLRAEGDAPFDYRPLLSYYLAVGLCGIAFIGMGLFSSLTSNQIIAAVMTFAGMLLLLLTIVMQGFDIGRGLQVLVGRFDFLSLWRQALSGTLPLAQGITYASLGIFWLFLTVNVLEARKWGIVVGTLRVPWLKIKNGTRSVPATFLKVIE